MCVGMGVFEDVLGDVLEGGWEGTLGNVSEGVSKNIKRGWMQGGIISHLQHVELHHTTPRKKDLSEL